MKLATVVVCYYPDEEVIQNIASYSTKSDYLYIWDNTPGGSELIGSLKDVVVMHHNHRNMGLAYAYNRAYETAEKDGATHLMTMDQDSSFEDFIGYRKWVENSNLKDISAITINQSHPDTKESSIITWACQSGSIFPIQMLKQVGPFREDLFIGMVDAEISLRAQEKGYKIVQYNKSGLIHKVGSHRCVKILGYTIMVSDYNALRHYYDSRNRILMWHEFPDDFDFRDKIHHLTGRIKVAVKIILFEKNKWAKIFAITKGTFYGFRNLAVPFWQTANEC